MSGLAGQWRSFWHTLTSNDRHASHDSPYRTGQHVPLSQSKHGPVATVTSGALESRTDLNSSYPQDLESGRGFVNGNGTSSPGGSIRGPLRRQSTMDSKVEGAGSGEIQMQSFADGLPPPPPVGHSWGRIYRWMEDNYEELFEQLGEPATINDVNELENELDCTLPQEVRESLQCHDGQERGGRPTGVFFGCMALDCEEIVQEWQNWRTLNEVYFTNGTQSYEIPQAPLKAFASSSSSAVPMAQAAQTTDSQWRQELQDKQDSQPPGAIQKVYAHPAWIPLARDWGGNNICVDLAPGPAGKWGQIILMGRDYDCKYVISRSWAAFLATVADDMNTDKWFIDEHSQELKLRAFKQPGVEPAYIDILRWRSDQKFGRRRPKQPLRINSQVAGAPQQNGYSPYGSPTGATEDRGRSPHRFSNGKAPATSSPRAHPHMSSPLARVTEESAQPLKLDTYVDPNAKPEKLISADTPRMPTQQKFEKLVPVDTPVNSEDEQRRTSLPKSKLKETLLSDTEDAVAKDGPTARGDEATKGGAVGDGEMKDVAI